MEAATGEWIAFLDSDDRWAPTYLAAVARAFHTRAPAQGVSLIHANCAVINAEGKIRRYTQKQQDQSEKENLLGWNCIGSASCVTVRRSEFLAAGGFRKDMRYAEDWEMWLRLSRRGDFILVEDPLVLYLYGEDDHLSLSTNVRAIRTGLVEIRKARGLPSGRLPRPARTAWRRLLSDYYWPHHRRRSIVLWWHNMLDDPMRVTYHVKAMLRRLIGVASAM